MSRQVFYFTRPHGNRQRRQSRFTADLRFVTLCFNRLPFAFSACGNLAGRAFEPDTQANSFSERFDRIAPIDSDIESFSMPHCPTQPYRTRIAYRVPRAA
ncbi:MULTISPECIES: hypothetical protein [Burkholderia]|uniref:hypothetical protein n=1 Tax=Burkholderia TaxID=32008 RepID=UPI000ACD85C9|nr:MULTISPECIES: hypothetical protein [Burkholderia]